MPVTEIALATVDEVDEKVDQTDFDDLSDDVSDNTNDISTNTTDISNNSDDISTNETNISTNTTDISNLDTDLNDHVTDTTNPHSVTASQVDAVPTSDVGANGGVAELDGDGFVPNSQLPEIATNKTWVVADEAEMLTLSDAQQGDVAVQTEENETWILNPADPDNPDPSDINEWQKLKTPTAEVSSVFGRTGDVTAESGDYDVSQITNAASDSDVDAVADDLNDHETDTTNPHSTTLEQVRSEDNSISGSINFNGEDADGVATITADNGVFEDELSAPEPTTAGDIGSNETGFFVVTDEDRVVYRYEA